MSHQLSGHKISSPSELISARREDVLQAYNSARATNNRLFLEGDENATAEYIFPNQMEDANNIVDKFYKTECRVISIQKKTKVGADGLIIEIAKLLTTHIDDKFVVNPANLRILTGMSNAQWEKNIKEKAPSCFRDKIFHHGKLSRAELPNICNGLFIIDEIDVGDKEFQVLHTTLKAAGVLDVKHMVEHNNRFVFISATMIKQQYDLYRWGTLHEHFIMTIPAAYFGHKDFLERGIIKEFYPLSLKENAEKWIQEDILDPYKDPCMCQTCNPEKNPAKQDFRIHIVRVTAKNVNVVQNACIRKGVAFINHNSKDRLSEDKINKLFKESLTRHIVIGIYNFYRRANFIPNRRKLRIGATHEYYTKIVDNNVQIQGLPGRLTGYWRGDIEGGHKTGPYRTSIRAIEEYEKTYIDPFGNNSYQTAGFKKNEGEVSADPTMLSAKNIKNLEAVELLPVNNENQRKTIPIILKLSTSIIKELYNSSNKVNFFKKIIEKEIPELHSKIKEYESIQCTKADSESTYKKQILDIVAKEKAREVAKINIEETNQSKNCIRVAIDMKENRLVITIWHGRNIIKL